LDEALEKLGYDADFDVMQGLMAGFGYPYAVSYDQFLSIFHHFHQLSTIEKRRRAGFSYKAFDMIRTAFRKHCRKAHADSIEGASIDKNELILLLIEACIPMDTRERRAELLEMFEPARIQARGVGISEDLCGESDSPCLKLWPMIHLIRACFQKMDRFAIDREKDAVVETQFSSKEVNQFRIIFQKCGKKGASDDDDECRKASKESNQSFDDAEEKNSRFASKASRFASKESNGSLDDDSIRVASKPVRSIKRRASIGAVPEMSVRLEKEKVSLREALGENSLTALATVDSIQNMLRRKMGIWLSDSQRAQFAEQISGYTGNDDDLVGFPDFLRLMKWMLVSDFAEVSTVAGKIAEDGKKSSEPQVAKGTLKAVMAAAKFLNLRNKGGPSKLRRASIA
jgi:hypothetical protein